MNPAKVFIIAGVLLLPSLGMARDEPPPDMEMLEFLGGFETVGGKPVDPLGFADTDAKEHKKELTPAAKKDQRRGRKPEPQEQKDRDNEK